MRQWGALMHKLLSLLQIPTPECSHREHIQGKTLVLGIPVTLSDLQRLSRQSDCALDISLPKRRVGDSGGQVTDALRFVGGLEEFYGANVFRFGKVEPEGEV